MSISDTYFTIAAPALGLFKDKASKFHAYAFPMETEDDLKVYLEEVKKEHPKARHHCFAFRLGTDDLIYRAYDDGEPSGSAGKPILNVLLSQNLRDVLVIVVRYFGGTLLGVPGLINAYKMATIEALNEATLEERIITEKMVVSFEMQHMNEVMRIVKKYDLAIFAQDYQEKYILTIETRLSLFEEVKVEFESLHFLEVQ